MTKDFELASKTPNLTIIGNYLYFQSLRVTAICSSFIEFLVGGGSRHPSGQEGI
jgi:hypothetical protein